VLGADNLRQPIVRICEGGNLRRVLHVLFLVHLMTAAWEAISCELFFSVRGRASRGADRLQRCGLIRENQRMFHLILLIRFVCDR